MQQSMSLYTPNIISIYEHIPAETLMTDSDSRHFNYALSHHDIAFVLQDCWWGTVGFEIVPVVSIVFSPLIILVVSNYYTHTIWHPFSSFLTFFGWLPSEYHVLVS